MRNKLSQSGLISPVDNWVKMAGGHTNQVWRVGDRVVKCYRQSIENPVFCNTAEDEVRALNQLQTFDIAPQFFGVMHNLGETWLVYEYLDGHHRATLNDVASLLQRVWRQSPDGPFRTSSLCPNDILAEGDTCNDALPAPDRFSYQSLGLELPDVIAARPAFLHGDPVAGNIVVTEQGARLIDWQSPSFGDATRDVAIFLSPAMQFLYDAQAIGKAEFLRILPVEIADRYITMQPLYLWWIERYCTWRAMSAGDSDLGVKYRAAAKIEHAALRIATKTG